MIFGGIVSGLSAALLQDCGYAASRIYVKRGGAPLSLLVNAQFLMGVLPLLLLPFLWPAGLLQADRLPLPLAGVVFGSFFGQLCFFQAERKIGPARLSSMMSLRVLLAASVLAVFGGARYNAVQWFAVGLAVAAAFLVNTGGGKFRTAGLPWLALSLASYCVSDISVKYMVDAIPGSGGVLHQSMIALCLAAPLSAFLALPLVRFSGGVRLLIRAIPYSSFWLGKQYLLYVCYAMIGPVHGNVVLAFRGPIAILLTLVLVHWFGMKDLSSPVDARTWILRGVSAVILSGAVVLYSIG